jgi:hypothetical protein
VGNHAERLPDFPTQLPLDLLRAVVGCASEPGDLVLDPFSGSGTTGVAAIGLGRRYVGIEKSAEFAQGGEGRRLLTTLSTPRPPVVVAGHDQPDDPFPVQGTLWRLVFLHKHNGYSHIDPAWRQLLIERTELEALACIRANGSPRFTIVIDCVVEYLPASGRLVIHTPADASRMAVPVCFDPEDDDEPPLSPAEQRDRIEAALADAWEPPAEPHHPRVTGPRSRRYAKARLPEAELTEEFPLY